MSDESLSTEVLFPVHDVLPGQLPDGVTFWMLAEIPRRRGGKHWDCTPKDVADAIELYASSLKDWKGCMSEYGIPEYLWYGDRDRPGLLDLYPECRAAFMKAQHRKADVIESAIMGIYDPTADAEADPSKSGLPSFLFEPSKTNVRRLVLTNAGQAWLKERKSMLERQALRLETGTRVQSQRIDQRTLSLKGDLGSAGAGGFKLPSSTEMEKLGSADLIALMFKKGGK